MIHPDQCNECGRFVFESCGKPKGRCPRKVEPPITEAMAAPWQVIRPSWAPVAVATAPAPAKQVQPQQPVAEQRQRARTMGYTGDICPTCSNFTMIRNGTCLKCDTCGSTTGCS